MLTKNMTTNLPALPGVYFFRDKYDKILYIGKSKSLRKRVRSYLGKPKKRATKIKRLVHHATKVDYEICESESEALLLESLLIKEHKPPYNSALKNGRKDWFVKTDLNDDFPRIELVSEIIPDGARYFGPFSSRKWTQEIIDILHQIFPIRTCEGTIHPRPDFRPCFSYDLKRCDAPCATRITREAYQTTIDDALRVLESNPQEVITSLISKRDKAATELRFERAAAIHKRIGQLKDVSVFLEVHRR
jgi:excinuclease ABC subunit C